MTPRSPPGCASSTALRRSRPAPLRSRKTIFSNNWTRSRCRPASTSSENPIEIELGASFPHFVQFVGQMEARGATLRRLQVHVRTSDTAGAALEVVTLLYWNPVHIDPALPPTVAQHLAAKAVAADPFRAFTDRSEASLRVGHHLTGITRVNNEVFAASTVATIALVTWSAMAKSLPSLTMQCSSRPEPPNPVCAFSQERNESDCRLGTRCAGHRPRESLGVAGRYRASLRL